MSYTFNVLTTADIHFGKKDDLKLFEELNEVFIPKLIELIKTDRVDMVCIAGDLYDRVIKMNELTSKLVIDFINNLCELTDTNFIYLRILKGTRSHDYNQLSVFKNLELKYPRFKIISNVESEDITVNYYDGTEISYKVLYLPEEYPTSVYQYYSDYFNQEYDMILGHGMLDECAFTGYDDENSERFVKNAPVFKVKDLMGICNGPIIFGHVHDFHEFHDKVYYCGSFSRFSFADKEDKGFIYSKYNPETEESELAFFLNENAPTYYTVNLDDFNFKDTEAKIKFLNNLKKQYDYIKVKTENDAENIDVLKSLVSNDSSIKMEVKNIQSEEDKIDEKFMFILNREYDLPTTIQKYLKITQDKDLSIDTIKDILKNN